MTGENLGIDSLTKSYWISKSVLLRVATTAGNPIVFGKDLIIKKNSAKGRSFICDAK